LTPVAIGGAADAGQDDLSATFTKEVTVSDVTLRKLDAGADFSLSDEEVGAPDSGNAVNDVSDVTDGSQLADANVESEVCLPSDVSEFSDIAVPADVSPAGDVGPASDVTPSAPVCGDGTCNGEENCFNCASDCTVDCPICSMLGAPICPDSKQCYPNGKANLCSKPGIIAVAKPCKFYSDCVSHALCVGGKCRSVCDSSGKMSEFICKPGVPCEKLVFAATNGAPEPLGVCKPGDDCDTLTDVGCDSGASCVAYGWLKTCSKAGKYGPGADCSGLGQCQLGSLCVDVGTGNKCCARCNTAGGAPYCAVGKCTAVLGPDGLAIPNNVGVCN